MTRVMNPRAHVALMDYFDKEGVMQPGPWRQEVDYLPTANRPSLGYRGRVEGGHVRDYLTEYFHSQLKGAVEWQWEHVFPRERFLY